MFRVFQKKENPTLWKKIILKIKIIFPTLTYHRKARFLCFHMRPQTRWKCHGWQRRKKLNLEWRSRLSSLHPPTNWGERKKGRRSRSLRRRLGLRLASWVNWTLRYKLKPKAQPISRAGTFGHILLRGPWQTTLKQETFWCNYLWLPFKISTLTSRSRKIRTPAWWNKLISVSAFTSVRLNKVWKVRHFSPGSGCTHLYQPADLKPWR